MQSPSSSRSAIIQSKLAPPPLPEHLISRPRLATSMAEMLDQHAALTVYATSGAGKTTTVQEGVRRNERPFAWLTVDVTDAAPGRLLSYVEAALGRSVPQARDAASAALAAGAPHEEAAGVLAETLADTSLVLVLDGLERIAESRDALAIVSALLRYAPSDVRMILVGRRELALDIGTAMFTRVASLGEEDLAFTVEEAAAALTAYGADADPQRVVELTGGWVAGVLFEAWRREKQTFGPGGEADPLHGYLASQILDRLPADDRAFLISTSVLDRVTVERCAGLGILDAEARLASLRSYRFPASWTRDGRELSCQPRFREYLHERLRRQGERRLCALRTANARLLLAEDHVEEAIEELLAVNAFSEASPLIERTIGAVIERLDYAVAERWLSVARPATGSAITDIAVGELMLAIGKQQYRRGAGVGDRLAEVGMRERLAASSGQAACMLAWCYWHVGRLADAQGTVEAAGPCPEQPMMRSLLSLCFDDVREPAAPLGLTGGPIDALIERLHWAHGRLEELRQAPASRWADAVARPLRVSALLAIGQTAEAAALVASAPGDRAGWLDVMAEVELLAETRHYDEAWQRLRAGSDLIHSTGSAVLEMLAGLLEARLLLCESREQEAVAVLDRLEQTRHLRAYRFVAEVADTWRGCALLRSDPGAAAEVLRRAIASMQAGDRMLELPRAAAYLAEAEWIVGNEEASDAAAMLALSSARRQGSVHRLVQGLADVPAVAARALDMGTDAHDGWHEIGRLLLRGETRASSPAAAACVELREFGELRIYIDGQPVHTRIRKCEELLAYLVSRSAAAVSRDELVDALFDGRDGRSTRAYLRQAIAQLRTALAGTTELAITPDAVGLAPSAAVDTESARFQQLVAIAYEQHGPARTESLQEALTIIDRGDYLPGVSSGWAEEQRSLLLREAGDARLELGETLFRHGHYREVEALLRRALRDEPYSERAWRLQIVLADAVGDVDGILVALRGCKSRLAELGLEPSTETMELVRQLRAKRPASSVS